MHRRVPQVRSAPKSVRERRNPTHFPAKLEIRAIPELVHPAAPGLKLIYFASYRRPEGLLFHGGGYSNCGNRYRCGKDAVMAGLKQLQNLCIRAATPWALRHSKDEIQYILSRDGRWSSCGLFLGLFDSGLSSLEAQS